MPKVTILIPVYNVEKYLEQCVRSAMGQTLQEIEIICLNDGSTDNSLEILQKLAAEDQRILIINKDNTGYGHTMNIGIRSARGKYIVFLESDDFILPDMCRRMYEVCEEKSLEVLKTDYYAFMTKKGRIFKRYRKVSNRDNYHMVMDATKQREVFLSDRYTWLCMYLKEYLWKYKILHNETPGAAYQDNGFWFQSMMYCRRVYYLNEAFYMYRMDNPNASIHIKNNTMTMANENAFLRRKVMDYSGEKSALFTISSIIGFKLNLWSAMRVAPEYLSQLSLIFQHELQECCSSDLFDFRMILPSEARQFLTALANPDEFCRRITADLDERKPKRDMLTKSDILILYGAGQIAQEVMWWIDELRIWDRDMYCAVTSPKDNEEYFQDMRIQSLESLAKYAETATVVLCTIKTRRYFKEMEENLKTLKFQNVVYADDILKNSSWLCDFVVAQ